jgi:hypothetical protein
MRRITALIAAIAAVGLLAGTSPVASDEGGEWKVVVLPEAVQAGEEFHVYARFDAAPGVGLGLPTLRLTVDDESPLVELKSEESLYLDSLFSSISFNWRLTALSPGIAHIRARVIYEKGTHFVSSDHEFSVEVEPGPPAAVRGDINGDGVADALDALLILQHTAGLLDLEG